MLILLKVSAKSLLDSISLLINSLLNLFFTLVIGSHPVGYSNYLSYLKLFKYNTSNSTFIKYILILIKSNLNDKTFTSVA